MTKPVRVMRTAVIPPLIPASLIRHLTGLGIDCIYQRLTNQYQYRPICVEKWFRRRSVNVIIDDDG